MPNDSRFTVALLVIVLLLVAVYSNTFKAAWHMDDYPNILNNPAVQTTQWDLDTLERVFGLDRTQGNNLSRPVANLSFALNWYWHGTNVAGYHLVNLMIHLFNFLLVYSMVLLLGVTPRFPKRYREHLHWIALGASVLWAFHPIQTQAVTYVVQRMTSLATLFYLSAMTAYLKCRLSPERRSRVVWGTLVAVAFLLAMGTKENAATLPMALVLIEAVFFQTKDGKPFDRRIGIVLAAGLGITLVFVTLFFLWSDRNIIHILSRSFEMRPFTLMERALTQPRVLVFYLSLLFYPIPQRLSLEHDFTVSTSLWHPWSTLPAIIFIAALIVFGILQIRKRPLVSFAILFFFLNHAVESTILPLEMVFEHRNYLPSTFLFLPVAAGFAGSKECLTDEGWQLAVFVVRHRCFDPCILGNRNVYPQHGLADRTQPLDRCPSQGARQGAAGLQSGQGFRTPGQSAQAVALYLKSMELQAPRRSILKSWR